MSQCTVLQTHWEHLVLKGYSSSMPSQVVIPFPDFMKLARKPCGKCGGAQMFSKHFSWSFQFHQSGLQMKIIKFYKDLLSFCKSGHHHWPVWNRPVRHYFYLWGSLITSQLQVVKWCFAAAYQACCVWSWACMGKTLIANPNLPDPTECGWTRDGDLWCPVCSLKPEASKAHRELISCSCRNSHCTGRCKCKKAGLSCTQLCFCEGQCTWLNQGPSDG